MLESQVELIRRKVAQDLAGIGVEVIEPRGEDPLIVKEVSGTSLRLGDFKSLESECGVAIEQIIDLATDAAVSVATSGMGQDGELLCVSVVIEWVSRPLNEHENGSVGNFICLIKGYQPNKDQHAQTA